MMPGNPPKRSWGDYSSKDWVAIGWAIVGLSSVVVPIIVLAITYGPQIANAAGVAVSILFGAMLVVGILVLHPWVLLIIIFAILVGWALI
jgi:hypothetical protein